MDARVAQYITVLPRDHGRDDQPGVAARGLHQVEGVGVARRGRPGDERAQVVRARHPVRAVRHRGHDVHVDGGRRRVLPRGRPGPAES